MNKILDNQSINNQENDQAILISVVIPVYYCEDCLEDLYHNLVATLSGVTTVFEIIMVNDASPGNDWSIIKEIARKDKRVKGVSFSRNFGQHYALAAGLELSRGKWVVTMDCDLQDDPRYIKELLNEAQRGYEIVFARRIARRGWLGKLWSKLFYAIFDILSGLKHDPDCGTFQIISRKAVDTFCAMPERFKFFGGIVQWMGYRSSIIDINYNSRNIGKSSYSFANRMKLGINAILSFSDKPLRLMIYFGFIVTVVSAIYAMLVIYLRFSGRIAEIGYASLIVSIYFLGGVILMSMGIIGIYIGRIYGEVKRRPYYIIGETTDEQ